MINSSHVKPISYKGEYSTIRITKLRNIPIFSIFREISKYNFKVKAHCCLFRNTWNDHVNFGHVLMNDNTIHECNERIGISCSRLHPK